MTYTEDGLVEQPAIALFSALGWDTITCWDKLFGEEAEGDLAFGRESRNYVVLTNRLLAALTSINAGTLATATRIIQRI